MKATIAALVLILATQTGEPTSTHLKRVSIEGLIYRLRQGGFRIHFERYPNQPEDAISLKEQIEIIEAIPAQERTEEETRLLKLCREWRASGDVPDHCIVNWKLTRFDFHYPKDIQDVCAVLDAIVKKNSNYSWKRISQSYVVYPKYRSSNKPIEPFSFQDADLNQARSAIIKWVTKPCNLNHIERHRPLSFVINETEYTLSCQGEDAHTVLTRFAEMLGPNIIWDALGTEKRRHFGFGNIPRAKEAVEPSAPADSRR